MCTVSLKNKNTVHISTAIGIQPPYPCTVNRDHQPNMRLTRLRMTSATAGGTYVTNSPEPLSTVSAPVLGVAHFHSVFRHSAFHSNFSFPRALSLTPDRHFLAKPEGVNSAGIPSPPTPPPRHANPSWLTILGRIPAGHRRGARAAQPALA